METRALCIAFFYAIGTAAGGITGPLLFGNLIDNASASGDITGIAPGYFLGAALMIAGGVVETSSASRPRASRWRASPSRSPPRTPRRAVSRPRPRTPEIPHADARGDQTCRCHHRRRVPRVRATGRSSTRWARSSEHSRQHGPQRLDDLAHARRRAVLGGGPVRPGDGVRRGRRAGRRRMPTTTGRPSDLRQMGCRGETPPPLGVCLDRRPRW